MTTRDDDHLFAAWAEAAVGEETPPARARAQLMEALAGIGRFRPLLDALGRLTDLAADALAAVLQRVDGDAGWIDGAPGVRYFHFTPGPGAPTREAGIVRLQPGAAFPRHRHVGDEVSFVLDGVLVDDQGGRHLPGSLLAAPAGSEHGYSAGAGRDLLLVSLHGGITFADPGAFVLRR